MIAGGQGSRLRTGLGLAGLALGGGLLALGALSPWYTLAWRADDSLPGARLYLIRTGQAPQRGDLAAFRMTPAIAGIYRDRPFARVGALWVKRVTGLPGDQISRDGAAVLVNGVQVATVRETDSRGLPMPVTAAPGRVPPGAYFLSLPHPRSFDSRYVGAIPAAAVVGVARPLL